MAHSEERHFNDADCWSIIMLKKIKLNLNYVIFSWFLGKWFNYGIIFLVMLLDLNMWKNQIFYHPDDYAQYWDNSTGQYGAELDPFWNFFPFTATYSTVEEKQFRMLASWFKLDLMPILLRLNIQTYEKVISVPKISLLSDYYLCFGMAWMFTAIAVENLKSECR